MEDNLINTDILQQGPAIDPIVGMTSGGVSDTTNMANFVMQNQRPYEVTETLSETLKRVASHQASLPTFNDIYSSTPDLNIAETAFMNRGAGSSTTGSTNSVGGGIRPTNTGGPFSFTMDEGNPFMTEIDLDQYYTRMSDAWDSSDQENAGLIGIGGGVASGAATGAMVGAVFGGPIGAGIGAIAGGVLGGIQGSQVAENIGYGYVRNKAGVDENSMSYEQGGWGRAGAGVMNLFHSANRLTLETATMLSFGIGKAIETNSLSALYDNEYSRLIDDYDKSNQSTNRIYHSNAYKDASLVGQVFHGEFIHENIMPGLGFLLGAMGIGKVTSLGMAGVGLPGAGISASTRNFLGNTMPKAIIRGEGTAALVNGFKKAGERALTKNTIKSIPNNFAALLTSAAPESAIEARSALNESYDNFTNYYRQAYGTLPTPEEVRAFNAANAKTANGVFGANVALVGMSNWLQFGDIIGADRVIKKGFLDNFVDKGFGIGIKKTLGEVSDKGLQSATWKALSRSRGQVIGHRVMKALEKPVTEGLWEEGMQGVISGVHNSYLESKFNPTATERNKTFMQALGESMSHQYGSREGWNELLAGMIIGGIGSIRRTPGGIDFLGQREISQRMAAQTENINDLNKTQERFLQAQQDLLNAQGVNNSYLLNFSDKLGGLNQQGYHSDLSKQMLLQGNLEQAQLEYQNAVFAKLSAERKAGLSDANKFDMDMMVDNIPEEVLQQMYGFTSPEQIETFKAETKAELTKQREAVEASYKLAENLGIQSVSKDFTTSQLVEQAALHFFQGVQSVDNAKKIGQAISTLVGHDGIADAMAYYTNLSDTNQKNIHQINENRTRVSELQKKLSDTIARTSTLAEKQAREPENEAVVREADALSQEVNTLTNQIHELEQENSRLEEVLSDRANLPTLPFGNPAIEYFRNNNLAIADSSVAAVLESLNSFEKYIEHLNDSTGKTKEQILDDSQKAIMISKLIDGYKVQMANMRNFAKAGAMISDPAYVNNATKSLFNRKRFEAMFNFEEWIDNNESGFSELDKAQVQDLKKKVDEGEISYYDLHTFLTNTELMRMNEGIERPLQEEDVLPSQTEDDDELPPNSLDALVVEGRNAIKARTSRLERIKEKKKEEARRRVEDKIQKEYPIDKVIRGEVQVPGLHIPKTQVGVREETQVVDMENVQVGDTLKYRGENRVVKEIETSLFGVNKVVFEDGMTVTNLLESSAPWLVEKVTREEQTTEEIEDGNEQLPEPTMNEVIEFFEAMIAEEVDKIEAQYQESINPTTQETLGIITVLNEIDAAIESAISELEAESKLIDTEAVDTFNEEAIPVREEYNRAKELFSKGEDNLSPEETAELVDLMLRLNNYGLLEGRILPNRPDRIRLSDLLEQRTQLENELFIERQTLTPLTEEEIQRVTTEETTVDETNVPDAQKTGDAAVLNTYEFSTFANDGNNYRVSNITPQGFIEEFTGEEGFVVTVLDSEGNDRGLDTNTPNWDNQIHSGDVVTVNFMERGTSELHTVSFSVDSSRRVIIPKGDAQTISDTTNIKFNQRNRIGASNFFVLTKEAGGTEVPMGSDFNIDIDSEAAQKLNAGDMLSFQFDETAPYNQSLMEEYEATHPDLEFISRANELIEEISQASKEAKKALYEEFKAIYFNIPSNTLKEARKAVKAYERSFDKKAQDEVRKKMKESMVIVAVDKNGNRVGIVKSLSNSSVRGNGKTQMDYLRTGLFEQMTQDGINTKVKSKFKVPVQLVYMGIPNVTTTDGQKDVFRFSDETGERNIPLNKVKSVGYVSHNEIRFHDNRKVDTPYNYAKKIMTDTTFEGARVPVVLFDYNGKEVIYPIQLLEKEEVGFLSRYEAIMQSTSSNPLTTTIQSLNNLLAEAGVTKQVRVTSMNMGEMIPRVQEELEKIAVIPTIEEMMGNEDFRETLGSYGIIDINITDKPFIGPKVRFNINTVPEVKSTLLSETSVSQTISPETLEEITKEQNKCLD